MRLLVACQMVLQPCDVPKAMPSLPLPGERMGMASASQERRDSKTVDKGEEWCSVNEEAALSPRLSR